MAVIPNSNLSGLPIVTKKDMQDNDPARLNRTLRLLATQIQAQQSGKTSKSGITTTNTVVEQVSGGSSSSSGSSSSGGSSPAVITTQGTHAQRISIHLAPSLPVGSYYYETDRDILYLNYLNPANVQVWNYVCGIYYAAYSALPTDLGVNDAGFIFTDNSTYLRSWVWSGSAWAFAVGQPPYLAIQLGMQTAAPQGYHLADGSTITVATSLAGTTTVALPNPYGYFIQANTYTGNQVAAVKSTINSYTPAGSVTAGFSGSGSATFAGTPETFTTASFVTLGGTTPGLTGPVTYTPSGSVTLSETGTITSTFTGTPATLTIGTEGTPPYMAFSVFVKL